MSESPFHPLDPAVIADPFPILDFLRETDPVHWHDGLEAWVVTRRTDCLTVLGNPELFVSDWRKVGIPTPAPSLSIQSLDPPEHTAHRRVLLESFRMADMDRLERMAIEFVQDTIERCGARGTFDFASDVARPLALAVACGFLGAEQPGLDAFSRISDTVVTSMDSGLRPEAAEPGVRARAQLSDMIAGWLEVPPRRGALSYLARSDQAALLPRDQVLNTVRAVVQAIYQSWGRFLGIAVLNLLRHHGAVEMLRRQTLPDRAVHELLRLESSVQADGRAAVRDVELGPRRISRGDVLVLIHGAADHDPAAFDAPDELILNRDPNPHLAFGSGIHRCPGAPLVVRLTRAVIQAVAASQPPLRLAGSPTWKPDATIRGLEILPVSLAG